MNRIPRLLSAFYQSPWAMLPAKLLEVNAFLLRASGVCSSIAGLREETESETLLRVGAGAATEAQRAEWQAAKAAAAARSAKAKGSAVAVLEIFGTIANRAENMEDMSGGTSLVRLAKNFRAALASEEVGAIVLDIDSPGGSVFGVDEMAAEIFAARGKKPIVAVADHMAASAACYLGSQAEKFYAAPTGEVGSIGVWMLHLDWSKALVMKGIEPTLISFGANKAEGNPVQPLSEETLAAFQGRVDEYGELFVKAVARGRGVTAKQVRERFGDGRMFGAKEAVERGLVDGIRSFDQVLASLGVSPAKAVPVAENLAPQPAAGEATLETRRRHAAAQGQALL